MKDITIVVPRWFRLLIIGQLFFNVIMWIIFMFIVITANIRLTNIENRLDHVDDVELKLLLSKIQSLDRRVTTLDKGGSE